jgi:benzaldehyde dehydrogenase (NAD)
VWAGAVFTGRWKRVEQSTDVVEPATGRVISRIGLVGADEVSRSAATARDAQRRWAEVAFEERARVLRRAAESQSCT